MPGRRASNFLLGKVAIDGALSTAIPVTGTGGGSVTVGSVTPPTGIVYGRITVTTAGTEVQGSSQALTQGVTVRALSANTGLMFVGGNASVSTTTGYQLSPNESVFIACDNLSDLWVDAAVSGNGVCYVGG